MIHDKILQPQIPTNPTYYIRWFNSSEQRVEEKTFSGKNAYEAAVKWGSENLLNFSTELLNRKP